MVEQPVAELEQLLANEPLTSLADLLQRSGRPAVLTRLKQLGVVALADGAAMRLAENVDEAVRDEARAELTREDEALSEELEALAAKLTEKQNKLAAKRQQAAEHAERTTQRCRQLERERAEATHRREQVVAVGDLTSERDEIARLNGLFDGFFNSI